MKKLSKTSFKTNLDKYFIFGIHENYTSQVIFNKIKKLKKFVRYNTYESIAIRHELKFKKEIITALNFVCNQPFGIEIDCDAIQNIPSSAQTPSGFSVKQTRRFIHYFGSHPNATYLHICEAAATGIESANSQTGKLLSYLITDFMNARNGS